MLAIEWDKQRSKVIADEDWCHLVDYAQCLFQALSMPLELAYLLYHLLAMCYSPAPSKTLLAKVIVAG